MKNLPMIACVTALFTSAAVVQAAQRPVNQAAPELLHSMSIYSDSVGALLDAPMVTDAGRTVGYVDEIMVSGSGDVTGLVLRTTRRQSSAARFVIDLSQSADATARLQAQHAVITVSDDAMDTARRFDAAPVSHTH